MVPDRLGKLTVPKKVSNSFRGVASMKTKGRPFDSGEGALETATTSKEGSRRVNYPTLTQGGSDNK